MTDIGRKREINQDYVFATDETIGNLPNLLVVADGMGGHRAGDFASRFTVEVLAEEVQNSKETHPEQILGNAIQTANERLMEESDLFSSCLTEVFLFMICYLIMFIFFTL